MDTAPDEIDVKPFSSQSTTEPPARTHRGSVVSSPHALAAVQEENYDTSHRNRGTALIFNHVNFESNAKREGSNKDRDEIKKELLQLGFDARVFNDLKKQELLAKLDEVAKEDHTESDCFVLVMMTHGQDGSLYAADKQYQIAELWEPFVGDACKTLIGKPKLFFVQACRGTKFDKGVKLTKIATDTVDALSSSSQRTCVIPTMADVLVMYSAFDGHYSWRNPTNGSWFIQSLSIELNQHAHRKELLQLLTSVSRRVAYLYESNVPGNEQMDGKKQMPCVVSMLTKALYFPRK
uniref:Uncharacterized protein n=1 Tax=Anopheles coluzzii TaxID=1518534 RepID=A0A8W7PJM0_ANOCL